MNTFWILTSSFKKNEKLLTMDVDLILTFCQGDLTKKSRLGGGGRVFCSMVLKCSVGDSRSLRKPLRPKFNSILFPSSIHSSLRQLRNNRSKLRKPWVSPLPLLDKTEIAPGMPSIFHCLLQ